VESEVYPDKLTTRGLEYVRPDDDEREEINRIIVDELVFGVFKPEAVAYFQRVITRLKDTGCDAVVLGCTEIPLMMNDSNSPLPTLDSTRLLARAALHRAVHCSTVKTRAEPRRLVVWLVSSSGVHRGQTARAWGWVLPCASIRRSRSLRSVRVNHQVNGRAIWL
jgi:Asp/Glu/Hydantoin racemase